MIRCHLFIFLFSLAAITHGQVSFWDYNPKLFYQLDHLQTSYPGLYKAHSAIRYNDPTLYITLLDSLSSRKDHFSKQYVMDILQEYDQLQGALSDTLPIYTDHRGIFNTFYRGNFHLIKIQKPQFFLTIDPMLSIHGGNNKGESIYQNTRGIKVRGSIDQKFYFYSSLYENQRKFLPFINTRIQRWNAIPGQGFYKEYQSSVLPSFNGWDYLNAQAYVGTKISPSIDLQFGFGNHFIGDGHRSMLLSDYAHNHLYLKLNTVVWKLHYQNLFTELAPIGSRDNNGDELLPKKYMVAHYLSFKASPQLSIGLYEAVVFSRNNQFEWQYLNPLILYRSVEQFLDSPDNVLLGLNLSYIPRSKMKLYGQLMIDEFRTDQIFSNNGWWGNKIGYQLGIKAFDLFKINNFSGFLEYNTARPYTYTHRVTSEDNYVLTSYSHYNQALAHPLGANFREVIGQLKYAPHNQWTFSVRFVKARYGDSAEQNVGFDILLDNETRSEDFGNVTGQGRQIDVTILETMVRFEPFPRYYIDLRYLYRNQTGEIPVDNSKVSFISLGITANLFNQEIDY